MPEQFQSSFAGGESSIILASASPRRRQLLAQAGYKFTSVRPNINEPRTAMVRGESTFLADATCCDSASRARDSTSRQASARRVNPCEYAKRLALAKAKNVAERYPDCLVIGADTIVDFGGQIIGKPKNAKDAEQITRKLFSKPHKVITAIAIVRMSDGIEVVESDSTTVYPKKMTDEQIAKHIKSGSWRDKAGAYAIQENGDEFVEKIDGSLTNVMGLPMELLNQLLKKFMD